MTLQALRDVVDARRYAVAVEMACALLERALSPADLGELVSVMKYAAEALHTASEAYPPEIGLHEARDLEHEARAVVVAASRRLLTLEVTDENLEQKGAVTLLYNAEELPLVDGYPKPLAVYETLACRFAHSRNDSLFDTAARAHLEAAKLHSDRSSQILAACDELVAMIEARPVASHELLLVYILRERSAALWTLKKCDDATRAEREFVERFGDTASRVIRTNVIRALAMIGLGRQDDEALRALDEIVERLADDPADAALRWIAWALARKALVSDNLGRAYEARATAEDLVRRFHNDDDCQLQERAEWATKFLGALASGTERPRVRSPRMVEL
jgi:hypothetical protein